MAGTSNSGPVPWWQLRQGQLNGGARGLPGAGNGNFDGVNEIANLEHSAPPGYQFDKVKGTFAPIVGSPSDALAQRGRTQNMENRMFDQQLNPLQPQTAQPSGNGGAPNPSNGGSSASMDGLQKATGSSWDADQARRTEQDRQHNQDVSDQAAATANGIDANRASMQSMISVLKGNGLLNPISAPTYGTPDSTAASAAVFARGKDRAAQIGQSSLRGLSDSLSARGVGGAGYEAGQVGKVAGQAESAVGMANRDATQMELEGVTHAADQNFQGQMLTHEEEAARQAQLLGQVGAAGRAPRPTSLTGLSASARAY